MAADDAETIRAMYDDHARGVFAYLARRVGRDLAEDLLAETYRIALETYPRFESERGTERMWLFGIATNLLRRHWRTEQRRLLAIERSAWSAEHIDTHSSRWRMAWRPVSTLHPMSYDSSMR